MYYAEQNLGMRVLAQVSKTMAPDKPGGNDTVKVTYNPTPWLRRRRCVVFLNVHNHQCFRMWQLFQCPKYSPFWQVNCG